MTKISFLFSLLLLLFCNAFGQTDSNATSVKDTNAAKAKPAQGTASTRNPAGSGDSGGNHGINDSSISHKTPKTPVATRPAKKDSSMISGGVATDKPAAAAPSAGASPSTGSGAAMTGEGTTAGITGTSTRRSGPSEVILWKSALAANPFFDFMGKPVVEPYEIHRPNSKDSLFYLLLGILFYFALIRIFFEKYFSNLLTLFFRVSLRQQQIREQVLQTPLPSLLLNLLFIATGGLYATCLLYYSRFGPPLNFWILYLDCMMGLGVIYLAKFLILKFCGWVFNISKATDIYIFIVFLVNKMLGIFLLPFLILITFSGPEMKDIFITISLTMIFVLMGYRVFASYRPVRSEIKLTAFQYFVYLCAFEIAPLLLIYKVLLHYLEKAY